MRYPLLAFLVIFVIPPFTAHAILAGKARFASQPRSSFSTTIESSLSSSAETTHNWTVAPRYAR